MTRSVRHQFRSKTEQVICTILAFIILACFLAFLIINIGCVSPRKEATAASVKQTSVPAKLVASTQAVTAKRLLVLVDETMKGRIDEDLKDYELAAFCEGWQCEFVWASRTEPRTAAWKTQVVEIGRLTRSKQFDALLIVGAVTQPFSGSTTTQFNGGHFFGATGADAFYAATSVPVEQWTSRDVLTATAAQPWPYNANQPGDGTFDVDYYAAGKSYSVDVRQKSSLGEDRAVRPKPYGRIDASRLGVFGISYGWTPVASDAEVKAVSAYLQRVVRWRLGRAAQLPSRVVWDNAFAWTDTYPYDLRKAWGRYGEIAIEWSVGDASTVEGKSRATFKPSPATAMLAYTGGGPGGAGPYLNFGPWNNDPSRRILDARVFDVTRYQVQVWSMYGSYIWDVQAPGSPVRAALLDPRGETVYVNPGWIVESQGPAPGRTFGDVWMLYLDSIAANVNNAIPVFRPGDGDPTILTQRKTSPVLVADLDKSGVHDFNDLLIMSSRYNLSGRFATGDVNLDGQVNFDDLLILASVYGKDLYGRPTVEKAKGASK